MTIALPLAINHGSKIMPIVPPGCVAPSTRAFASGRLWFAVAIGAVCILVKEINFLDRDFR